MRKVLLGAALVAVLVSFWTALTQVNSGERGVVRRFGRVIEIAGPGLHIGLPWGIDRVERVAVDRERSVRIGYVESDGEDVGLSTPAGQLLTGDHNLVNMQVVLNYAARDTEVERFVLYGDQADGLVARAAEAVAAEWIASRTVDDVLLTGKVLLPTHIVAETQKRIDPYQLGIQIKLATVHLLAPREVKAAFDDVTRAQAEIETLKLDAYQVADLLRSEAQAEKFNLEKMSTSRAVDIVKLGEAYAKGFEESLKLYRLLGKDNPNYLAMLWWDEMSRLYARMRETGRIDLLDQWLAGDGFDILQMPLMQKKN